jgi:hypothetical protein
MKTPVASKSMLTKFAVGAVAVSALAVGGIATVSAYSDSATSSVTVQAGDINLQLGGAKTLPIDLGQNIKPGASYVKTFTINNTGSLPLTYTAATTTSAGNLAPVIDVNIKDVTVPATPTAIGTAKKLNAVAFPSKTIAAGAKQDVEMTFTWANGAAGAENALMDQLGSSTITFTAAQ